MIGVTLIDKSRGSNVLKEVSPGSPAENAGLMAGDRIVAINGAEVDSYDKLSGLLKENGIKELEIQALRNGALVSAVLTPSRQKPMNGTRSDSSLPMSEETYRLIHTVGRFHLFDSKERILQPHMAHNRKSQYFGYDGPIGM